VCVCDQINLIWTCDHVRVAFWVYREPTLKSIEPIKYSTKHPILHDVELRQPIIPKFIREHKQNLRVDK